MTDSLAAFDTGQLTIDDLNGIEATDLLERACAWGRIDVVNALYTRLEERFDDAHPFVYESWALVLALRCAHEDIARNLCARGVDLLAAPRRGPWTQGLLISDDSLTRFALTRSSPHFLSNPMDPTTSTEVFRDFHSHEQLIGDPYAPPVRLDRSCTTVERLAREGSFDELTFCDLFRASLVRAWQALRHDAKDTHTADLCLGLCQHMLDMHRACPHDVRYGSDRLYALMDMMIVPRGSVRIDEFICEHYPASFFHAVCRLDWLRRDLSLVHHLATQVDLTQLHNTEQTMRTTITQQELTAVLETLTHTADLNLFQAFATLPQVDDAMRQKALDAASKAGVTEISAWLLTQLSAHVDPLDALRL